MPQVVECCRICNNERLAPVLSLGNEHLTGVFPLSPDEQITCGPLEIVKCQGPGACGLLQLGHSYDLEEMYGDSYGYRSGLNTSMVEHLKRKTKRLQTLVPLASGDLVLDIREQRRDVVVETIRRRLPGPDDQLGRSSAAIIPRV